MIQYYNRKTGKHETEKVAGDKYLNWTYSSPIGMTFLEAFIKRKLFSKMYGKYCDTSYSANKIPAFVKEFDIDMSIYEDDVSKFKTFNDFFYRKVTKKGRPVDLDSNVFISPADGRLLAYENINLENLVQIKGFTYSLYELIKDSSIANKFNNGICLIFRLCPVDYHRFHFIDSGICSDTSKIKGSYYSVNPIALSKKEKLYCQNKREWSIFKSDNFGDILYVEVGATCVGSIEQTYSPGKKIIKGDEKGYFKFGGSTVILFLQKDIVQLDNDIIQQSSIGFETKVNFGEKIGTLIK